MNKYLLAFLISLNSAFGLSILYFFQSSTAFPILLTLFASVSLLIFIIDDKLKSKTKIKKL